MQLIKYKQHLIYLLKNFIAFAFDFGRWVLGA